jgi:hypothetical protein
VHVSDGDIEHVSDGDIEIEHLIDAEVVEIKLYGGIELVFGDTRDSVLQIESDLEIVRGGRGITVHFAPATDEEICGLDDLAAVFRRTVIAAVATADGSLTLVFSNSLGLRVEHDDNYEAWKLSRRSGGTLVSLPGGGLG